MFHDLAIREELFVLSVVDRQAEVDVVTVFSEIIFNRSQFINDFQNLGTETLTSMLWTVNKESATYEITDTLGVPQTLKLLGGVATTPTGLEWSAGMQMDMITRVGGVSSADINNGSVTTVKLADGAVTTVKIADDAVTTAKILADAVTAVKIVNGAVTTSKINAKAVTLAKVADGTPGKWLKFNDGTGVIEEADEPTITKGTTTGVVWTNGAVNTIAHSAGATPDDVFIDVVCQVAEAGYTPGNVIRVAPYVNQHLTSTTTLVYAQKGCSLRWDATNVYFTVAPSGIQVAAATGSAAPVLTASNWLVQFPWRIY